MKVTIEVTQEDIDLGVRMDGGTCPIARAAVRALPGLPAVWVYSYGVARNAAHEEEAFAELPDEAKNFIAAFDATRPVEPFSFELDVPAELAPAGESL